MNRARKPSFKKLRPLLEWRLDLPFTESHVPKPLQASVQIQVGWGCQCECGGVAGASHLTIVSWVDGALFRGFVTIREDRVEAAAHETPVGWDWAPLFGQDPGSRAVELLECVASQVDMFLTSSGSMTKLFRRAFWAPTTMCAISRPPSMQKASEILWPVSTITGSPAPL